MKLVQSKMNKLASGSYLEARELLEKLPLDAWIRFDNLPQRISFEVVDLLDGGYKPHINVVFNEMYDSFLLTRRIIKN